MNKISTIRNKSLVREITWSARDALSRYNRITSGTTFALSEAVAECYRLVTAGAQLLSLRDHDTVVDYAYFAVEQMELRLHEGPQRPPNVFACGVGCTMMPFIDFAKVNLRLRYPRSTVNVMSQLFEVHSEPYFANDPDVNPNLLTGMFWNLYHLIDDGDTAAIAAAVQAIVSEITSVPAPLDHEQYQIDHAAIADRLADPQIEIVVRMADPAMPSLPDESERIQRLLARRDALLAEKAPAASVERLQMVIEEALEFQKRVEDLRLEFGGSTP
ncbi:hypothetical protein EMQ25_11665 [Arsenicitalea aurantiaca]|uniref:Uncharacterized protein n=1 Tax=Arsenicitalea aurantiaca TaxID=1783274 RepID=A0A433X7G7_9HYPH|nr:hypothetical protein [Arsenicitalea aurantiaca]RUT29990.1 hypothetical protein EMQ25_11665 [Arsenicitalea aurantiaca]